MTLALRPSATPAERPGRVPPPPSLALIAARAAEVREARRRALLDPAPVYHAPARRPKVARPGNAEAARRAVRDYRRAWGAIKASPALCPLHAAPLALAAKPCPDCGEVDRSKFGRHPGHASGLKTYCVPCESRRVQAYKRRAKEKLELGGAV